MMTPEEIIAAEAAADRIVEIDEELAELKRRTDQLKDEKTDLTTIVVRYYTEAGMKNEERNGRLVSTYTTAYAEVLNDFEIPQAMAVVKELQIPNGVVHKIKNERMAVAVLAKNGHKTLIEPKLDFSAIKKWAKIQVESGYGIPEELEKCMSVGVEVSLRSKPIAVRG